MSADHDGFRPGMVEWKRAHTLDCEVGDPYDLESCDCPAYIALPHQCDAWKVGSVEQARALAAELMTVARRQPERDPTPWCNACGAKVRSDCDCGPLARND